MALKIENIVIVKYRAMGDALIGLSSLQYLKSQIPNVHITYIVPKWIAPLLINGQSAADEILGLDFKTTNDWIESFGQLLNQKIDWVYELHQSGSSGHFFKTFCFLTRKKYFFSNHNSDPQNRKAAIQRDLDGLFSALVARGEKIKSPHFLDYPPYLKFKDEITIKRKSIIFGVVATRETKKWPLEYFVQLAKKIEVNFPEIEVLIPISKNRTDQIQKENLLSLGMGSNCRFVELPLQLLPLELANSILYIGNDTGLKHLCVALGIQTFTFFGPEEPLEWHPYDKIKHPYFFVEQLECRTEISHFCPLQTCQTMICLNQFKVDDVFNRLKMESLLKGHELN